MNSHLLELDPAGPDALPRPRVLVFGPVPPSAGPLAGSDTVRLTDALAVADALHDGGFSAVVADPTHIGHFFDDYRRQSLILTHADRGIAFTDLDGRVVWSNHRLVQWCNADPVGEKLHAALGAPTVATEQADPIAELRKGTSVQARLHRPGRTPEYIDLLAHPVFAPDGTVCQFLALCRNVSAEVDQQRKLDALHQAGRELVELDAATIAEVSVRERIESLKDNLRRLIHDLLHYDIIEVRLYDRRTKELRPLLEEGMAPEAARRRLFAAPDGNGITGWVAHTRQSYLCQDAATDPKYLTGATGARSSLTVPLISFGELVGTFNVESPTLGGFTEEDLQFTELFSKEIAGALHTLDLLSAQQCGAATHSVEMVSREIALPVDEMMASAAVLQQSATDPEVIALLKNIMHHARRVKECVRRVGEQAAEATVTPTPKPLAGKRVLVLEQDARLRREAHLILERLGACAETAGTAADALALLENVGYDAVLMEVRPVDCGGFDTYSAFHALRPGVPVFMTNGFGYDENHNIVKAKAAGMKRVLFKPFKTDQIISAVLDSPSR